MTIALRKDKQGVLARAQRITQTGMPRAPKEVLRALAPERTSQRGGQLSAVHELRKAGRRVAVMTVHSPACGGGIDVTIEPRSVSEEAILKSLREVLGAD